MKERKRLDDYPQRPIPNQPGDWDEFVRWFPPKLLDPPHAVTDEDKFNQIRNDMKTRGWCGPPLLALHARGEPSGLQSVLSLVDGDIQLLEGSHRISAALDAGLAEVPLLVVSINEGEANLEEPFDAALHAAREQEGKFERAVTQLLQSLGHHCARVGPS